MKEVDEIFSNVFDVRLCVQDKTSRWAGYFSITSLTTSRKAGDLG